jgi:hypothetical protein
VLHALDELHLVCHYSDEALLYNTPAGVPGFDFGAVASKVASAVENDHGYSTAYSFSIRMRLEGFSRCILFVLGDAVPRAHLKSADADGRTFQKIACIRQSCMFASKNLAKLCQP